MEISERERRMGSAPIGKLLLSMGIPTLVAQFINLLYNIVDRIYIGHIPGCGAAALTGVGLCLPIITLITAFSRLFGIGGAPLAAIELGKGDREKAGRIVGNSTALLFISSICLVAVFYIIKKPFMYAFGASDSTYPYANTYLSIYLIGTLFVQIEQGLNSFITAQGRSRVAMAAVLIGAVANIALDPLFIFVFDLGIAGAAIATVISQGLAAAWTLGFLVSKRASLRVERRFLKIRADIVKGVLALGISPFVMSSTESLITIVFNSSMAKYGNDLYVGSITIMQSVMQMVFVPLSGFTTGVQPIISYNYGAGNIARVREACKKVFIITTVTSFVLSLTAILLPGPVAGLFTDDSDLIEICRRMMPLFLAGMLIAGMQNGCQQSFLALGQAKQSLFFALFRKVILLVPLALVLPMITGSVVGVYAAEPISDALSAIACAITFWRFAKKL